MTGLDVMAARRLGEALRELEAAKGRGWDFTLHTSFCSEQAEIFVLRLKAPQQVPHAAKTRVGALEEVLRWGAHEVGIDAAATGIVELSGQNTAPGLRAPRRV